MGYMHCIHCITASIWVRRLGTSLQDHGASEARHVYVRMKVPEEAATLVIGYPAFILGRGSCLEPGYLGFQSELCLVASCH